MKTINFLFLALFIVTFTKSLSLKKGVKVESKTTTPSKSTPAVTVTPKTTTPTKPTPAVSVTPKTTTPTKVAVVTPKATTSTAPANANQTRRESPHDDNKRE